MAEQYLDRKTARMGGDNQMKITINIDTGNSAFYNELEGFDYSEVARILAEIVPKFEHRDYGKCIDINGNIVGDYEVTR